jgi:hypothetical protein
VKNITLCRRLDPDPDRTDLSLNEQMGKFTRD